MIDDELARIEAEDHKAATKIQIQAKIFLARRERTDRVLALETRQREEAARLVREAEAEAERQQREAEKEAAEKVAEEERKAREAAVLAAELERVRLEKVKLEAQKAAAVAIQQQARGMMERSSVMSLIESIDGEEVASSSGSMDEFCRRYTTTLC